MPCTAGAVGGVSSKHKRVKPCSDCLLLVLSISVLNVAQEPIFMEMSLAQQAKFRCPRMTVYALRVKIIHLPVLENKLLGL
jgi:hypothetical protein